MARDPIDVLRLVRRQAVEEACRIFADCLTAEDALVAHIQEIDAAAARDRLAHPTIPDVHQFLETFARHTQASNAQRSAAEAALAEAQARTAEARATVVAARTAAEALETLIEERAVADLAQARRLEQRTLDDTARNRLESTGRPTPRPAR